MRKRFRRNHKIYTKGIWFCFRITDSFGRRPEIKSTTKQEARLKLLEMTKQVISNITGATAYKVTIEQGVDFWLKHKKGSIDDTSYRSYENHINNFKIFLSRKFPEVKFITELLPEHIKEFMDFRISEGRATKTVNLERNSLFNLFFTLIDNKKIPDFNPVAKTKRFKVKQVQNRRCLSEEELYTFFEGAKKAGDNWYAVFWTLYIGGFRRSEVRTMTKDAIDLKSDSIKVFETKTDTPKCVPIHPQLKPILKQAMDRAKGNLVFPNAKGGMLPKNAMRDKMVWICKKVGILQATLHDFRHTFASNPNMSEDVKQNVGGWSNKRVMQETYMHPQAKYIKNEYYNCDFIPKPPMPIATLLPQERIDKA
jgi:integrase